MTRAARGLAALVLVLWAGQAVAAEWTVGCTGEECRLGQLVTVDGALVARVMVYQLSGTEVVEVLFPLGVSLLAPAVLEVDGKKRFEIRTANCLASGCVGVVQDSAGAVAAFRAGLEMKLRFTGFEDGGGYFYPFTLKGFSAAYERYRNKTP